MTVIDHQFNDYMSNHVSSNNTMISLVIRKKIDKLLLLCVESARRRRYTSLRNEPPQIFWRNWETYVEAKQVSGEL